MNQLQSQLAEAETFKSEVKATKAKLAEVEAVMKEAETTLAKEKEAATEKEAELGRIRSQLSFNTIEMNSANVKLAAEKEKSAKDAK